MSKKLKNFCTTSATFTFKTELYKSSELFRKDLLQAEVTAKLV